MTAEIKIPEVKAIMRDRKSAGEEAPTLVGVVGVVIPTLGNRPKYLEESLRSVIDSGIRNILIVAPETVNISQDLLSQGVTILRDPGRGLAAAINLGISQLPGEVDIVTWLGDDDSLIAANHSAAVDELKNSRKSAVYGSCEYVDEFGSKLFHSRSGRWAVPLMRFGPQLVPQPGSLLTRSAFNEVGGLDETLHWAFDLDLFIRLSKFRKGFRFINSPVAQFRWHADSLTAGSRKGSVREASRVRKKYLPGPLATLSWLWEPVISWLILQAGALVNRRAARKKGATG